MKVYINGPGLLHMKNTVARICHRMSRWSRVDDRFVGKLTNKKNKNEIIIFMTEKHEYTNKAM